MSSCSRYHLRSRTNANASKQSSQQSSDASSSPQYVPFSVVAYPQKDANWCCKCTRGPPQGRQRRKIRICDYCSDTYSCMSCLGYVGVPPYALKDRYTLCFNCRGGETEEIVDEDSKLMELQSDEDVLYNTPKSPSTNTNNSNNNPPKSNSTKITASNQNSHQKRTCPHAKDLDVNVESIIDMFYVVIF